MVLSLILSPDALGASTFGYYHALMLTITLVLLAPTTRIIYNRYFHPLHTFPGPFWGGVTDFYHTYLFSTRRLPFKTLDLHKKYGPFVRLAPNLLSFSDPELLPKIYHRHADKTPFYSTAVAGDAPPLLQTQDEEEHNAKLKPLSPTHSMGHIRMQENIVDEEILMMIKALHTRFSTTRRPLDLAVWIRWHIYDTVTHLIYGKPVGMVEEGCDTQGLIQEWHRVFPLGGLVATLPWLIHPIITNRYLKRFLMPSKGHGFGSGHVMRSHERLFQNRLKNPQLAHPGNLFDSFREMKHADGRKMSLEEAEHECFVMTVGSQDTTAALISPLINYVLQQPKIYRKLMDEVCRFERDGRLSTPVVSFEETTNLPYFMACVYETLRLSPSVSMTLPRFTPAGGITINDTWIPESTEIAANPFVVHRNERIFGPDVDDFRPERWLEDREQVRLMHRFSFAFGYGSRKCLGRHLALFEAQKCCLQLFRSFDMRCCDADRPLHVENWGINIYSEQHIMLQARKAESG